MGRAVLSSCTGIIPWWSCPSAGTEIIATIDIFRVLHLVLVTDLPASTGSLPPDLNIWYSDLLAGVLILNVLEFLITGAVSLIRYEFTHQDGVLILNVLDVVFSSPVYSWQWCLFSLYVKQACYDVIFSVTNSTSIFYNYCVVLDFLLRFDSWINTYNYINAVMLSLSLFLD